MGKLTKAALCAAGFMCASGAQAASFYQLDFYTSGFGQTVTGFNTGNSLQSSPLNNVIITYKFSTDLPLVPFKGSFGNGGTFYEIIFGTAGITFSDRTPSGRVADETRTATACFENSAVAASGTPKLGFFAANPSCGSAQIRLNDNTFSMTDYSGVVTAVNVSLRDGQVFEATTITNGVPEPTTWALMLAGFGMVGFSLRRRRERLALA